MMTETESVEFIADEIRQALKNFVGKSPDREAMKQRVIDALPKLDSSGDFGRFNKVVDVVAELMTWQWLGIPEDGDLKALVRSVPDGPLFAWMDEWGYVEAFPMNLLWVEYHFRKGNLDWEFSRVGQQGTLNITLKKPVNYIELTLEIGEEPDE